MKFFNRNKDAEKNEDVKSSHKKLAKSIRQGGKSAGGARSTIGRYKADKTPSTVGMLLGRQQKSDTRAGGIKTEGDGTYVDEDGEVYIRKQDKIYDELNNDNLNNINASDDEEPYQNVDEITF
jgi:hypothetical protein